MGKRKGLVMAKRKRQEAGSFDVTVERLEKVRVEVIKATEAYRAGVEEMARRKRAKIREVNASPFAKNVQTLLLDLARLRGLEERLRKVVDRGPGTPPTVTRRVENPMRADEQVLHEIKTGTPRSAHVDVDVSMRSLIGGLARIKGLTEGQIAAARRFRSYWDSAQLGGARAIDYEQVRVDTSGSGMADVTASGEEARRRYRDAVQFLGMVRSNLVERVVCDEMSLRSLGRMLGRGNGGKATHQLAREVLDAVDALAQHLREGPAVATGRIRRAGERVRWGQDAVDGEQSEPEPACAA